MNVNWKKLLAAFGCWTVVLLLCVVSRVQGAEYAATVDGILRSVVAVRSQLEPILRNRLEQRTSTLRQTPRPGGLSCGGVIQIPGLQRLFKCVLPGNRPGPPTVQHRIDSTQQQPPAPTITTNTNKAQDDLLRANPHGILFPDIQQINQFNQWQRPLQRPTARLPVTTTSTTVPPEEGDFYFPQNEEDLFAGLVTAKPVVPYYTTRTTPSSHSGQQQHHWETSTTEGWAWTDEPDVTKDGPAETTTEPVEEEIGLGNRIDQKLLLSLVG
uniref:Uncharacterized protein n=1 Tax=Anopheles farauti TaxID=69004 RepID=A0A182Q614_9DIPT